MRPRRIVASLAVVVLLMAPAAHLAGVDQFPDESRLEWKKRLREIIEHYLGCPYVFGCSGPKRFDCSGFVWRVMSDMGIHMKRTSARKLFLILPKAAEGEQSQLGAVVFFNRLRHCGLVEDSSSFYHASRKLGTVCSAFQPYWYSRITGFRKIPREQG